MGTRSRSGTPSGGSPEAAEGTEASAGTSAGAGFALALVSAAFFGTSGAFAVSLVDAGWSPAAAVTARVVAAAALLAVPALVQLRGRWHLLRRGAGVVAVYGLVAIAGCQLAYFNAVSHLPVAVALLLEYSGTFLVVLWMWGRHGQRPRALTVGGGLLALVGLVLVLDLTGVGGLDVVGALWGLGAAVGLAVYFVLSAGVSGATAADGEPAEPLPPLVMAWGGMVVGALALLAAGAAGLVPVRVVLTDVTLVGRSVSWLVPVLGLAVMATVVGYVAGIAGARRLGARVASFIGLTEVLFAVLIAWLLLGQVPAPVQLLGGVLVVAGIVAVRLDELRGTAAPAPVAAAGLVGGDAAEAVGVRG